jgi:hypothetical protein
MSEFWEEFRESDPTRKPPPDWYFWPGVAMIVIVVAVFVIAVVRL